MLTILVGTDTKARAKRLEALMLAAKKKGTDVHSYSDVDFKAEALRELAASASLFGGTLFVSIKGVADTADKRDELESVIPALSESAHEFVVSENSLLAPFLKKVATHDGHIEKFELAEKIKKQEAFNSFLLTDAFSARTRSQAWALYRKAIALGVESRELHGKLYWAVKSMLVARDAKSAGESGLNPFVYQKSKAGAAHFFPGELETMLRELTVMFHEALVSGIDLESALEAFILRSLAKPESPLSAKSFKVVQQR